MSRRLSVAFTPAELPGGELTDRSVAVIDVLRATTTLTVALAAGAVRAIPAATPEEARERTRTLDPATTLLCGERGGRPLPGFALGNSPGEYTPAAVGGRTLIVTTTNGTKALLAAASAPRVILASFLNAAAAVRDLHASGRPVLLVASGQENRVAAEDVLAAGLLVAGLAERGGYTLDDAARLARVAWETSGRDLAAALAATDHGRTLTGLGFGKDVVFCAGRDRLDLVPVFRAGEIVPADQDPQASR